MRKLGLNLKKKFHQPWFGGMIGALLASFLGLCFLLTPFGKSLRDWSYDLPFLIRPEQTISNVVVIYLDEKTYKDLEQEPSNFDRGIHAKLVRRLKAAGAHTVVFDILFIDARPSLVEGERELAKAIKEHGNVILASSYHQDRHLGRKTGQVLPPVPRLRDACSGWGSAMLHRDSDFSARLHPSGTESIPSLAWKAALAVNPDGRLARENPASERWLNYYSSEPFQGVSYSDVLEDSRLPGWFSFSNKVVFVGSGQVAGSTGDEKEESRYPWTPMTGEFILGVDVHAVTFSNLIRRDWLRRLPGPVEIGLTLLVGVFLGFGLCAFRPFQAAALAALFAISVASANYVFFTAYRLWMPWLIPVLIQVPVALGWAFLFYSIKAHMETRLLKQSLEFYLSPQQADEILKQPDLLKPGARERTVSILFSDIANFSKISERMAPDDLANLLNNYYETAIGCVHSHNGTVMNIIGDAIFAIWNAPQEQPDHTKHASEAALRLSEQLVHFDASSSHLPLRTRIGLHTARVSVGNIGSTTHFHYTAIGEGVNLASRLEGLNKKLGTTILATRDMQKELEPFIDSRFVGDFRFTGFDRPVKVYELMGRTEGKTETPAWRTTFAEALRLFQRGSFPEAKESFARTLELRQKDGPATFYIKYISELEKNPPGSEWLGEIDLREK